MPFPRLHIFTRPARAAFLAAAIAFAAFLPSSVLATALYVADSGDNTVYSVSVEGKKTVFASGLTAPVGLAFDPSDNLFVACTRSVVKITHTGVATNFAGNFGRLTAIIRQRPSGLFFVADSGDQAIYEINPRGPVTRLSKAGNAPFQGVASDPVHNLYCLDFLGRIVKTSPASSVTRDIMSGRYSYCRALAIDKSDCLYVADYGQNTVFRISPDGTRTVYASELLQPTGLAFDEIGNLFVACAGSGDIIKITPGGHKSAYATGFDQPAGLAFGVDPPAKELATP